jgi:hypothetical protein
MRITHEALMAEIAGRRRADIDRRAAEFIPAAAPARAARPNAGRGDRPRMITRGALLPRLIAMENWQRLAALEDSR